MQHNECILSEEIKKTMSFAYSIYRIVTLGSKEMIDITRLKSIDVNTDP